MKILALIGVLLLAGCSSTNITKLVQAAAKDPAKVHIQVNSPWGTVIYDRDNSSATNITIIPMMISTNWIPFSGTQSR